MIREGTVPHTAEELKAWIAERPDVRATLEKGGYGSAFEAGDLLPLLQVFIGPDHGPERGTAIAAEAATRRWLIVAGVILLLAVVLMVLLL